jgi:ATP-dependent 26S proteasome regulatory subunit
MDEFTLGVVSTFAVVGIFAGAILVGKKEDKSLLRQLKKFFDVDPRKQTATSKTFQGIDLPNVHLSIGKFADKHNGTVKVIGHGGYGLKYLNTDIGVPQSQAAAIQYESIDIGVNERLQVPRNGIYLLSCDKGKLALDVHVHYEGAQSFELILLSNNSTLNGEVLEEIRELVGTESVFKGKILSIEGEQPTADVAGFMRVRFHEFAKVTKEQIILPEKTLSLIERNVTTFYKHTDALRKAGKSLKRGVLFYGKPGTGKTFTAKYLSQELAGVTVFLLSGEQLWLIKEAFALARLLAPSLVIMEDVDLIAHSRDATLGQTILHQLLNELDGLTRETEVIFLLTTNRPEVLEPALSLRPGRIDQAIKFPLPDASCRQRLIEQYAEGVALSVKDMAKLVDRTEGASPAFIQELMRKSALFAADGDSYQNGSRDSGATDGDSKVGAILGDATNGDAPTDDDRLLLVKDEHMQAALDELLLTGSLTRALVGFHTRKSENE